MSWLSQGIKSTREYYQNDVCKMKFSASERASGCKRNRTTQYGVKTEKCGNHL